MRVSAVFEDDGRGEHLGYLGYLAGADVNNDGHFSRSHICALIYYICFSLSYFTLYDRL